MAMITRDPVPTNTPNFVWIMIALGILIISLSIKEWRRRAKERRWKAWENRNTA